jgi:hypothetical protein
MRQSTINRGDEMRKIILISMALTLFACAPTQYHDYRDYPEENVSHEMKFSDDPLLDSTYRARYLEMLRRCGSGKDECRKGR